MHPLAWWAWALGIAAGTTRLTDLAVIALALAAVVLVTAARRQDTPWARAFRGYLVLAGAIVVLRLVFHVVVGIKVPGTVVLDLPRIALPAWAVGVELFGPVTVAGLRGALVGGLRLAALVVCFGAANALANPRAALRSLPASLHGLATAVVIAVSVTPQLVQAAAGVRRARRLRGDDGRGLRSVTRTAVPVLTDALDRALALAASMDSRGYARALPGHSDRRVGALLLGALVAAALGTYGLLDGTSPAWLGLPVLGVGATAAVAGSVLAGRQVRRTRYRPARWGGAETFVAACGAVAGVLLAVGSGGAAAGAGPAVAVLGVVVAAAPAVQGIRAEQEAVA